MTQKAGVYGLERAVLGRFERIRDPFSRYSAHLYKGQGKVIFEEITGQGISNRTLGLESGQVFFISLSQGTDEFL